MSTFNYTDFIKQIQDQQTKANTANEARYKELVDLFKNLGTQTAGTYSDILGSLSNLGQSEQTRIQQAAVKQMGNTEQDLISRGLGNTTIRTGAQRAINSDTQQLLSQLAENVAVQKAGVQERASAANTDITRMLASVIEGRNDTSPDISQYAALLQQALAAGNGQKLSAVVPNSPSSVAGFGTAGSGTGSDRGVGNTSLGSGGGGSSPTTGGNVQVLGPVGSGYNIGQNAAPLSADFSTTTNKSDYFKSLSAAEQGAFLRRGGGGLGFG